MNDGNEMMRCPIFYTLGVWEGNDLGFMDSFVFFRFQGNAKGKQAGSLVGIDSAQSYFDVCNMRFRLQAV